MSNSLEQLMKISQFKINEKRRKISILREMSERLQHNLNELDLEMNREFAIDTTMMPPTFKQNYIKAAQEKKASFLLSIQKIDLEIELLSDELRELFMEMKRYEIANQKREVIKKHEINRKRNQTMDEVAARVFIV